MPSNRSPWPMPITIVDVDSPVGHPAPACRRPRPGAERDLLDWFLATALEHVPRGHVLTVFREPRLASGFPDLVIVAWKPSVARGWSTERRKLQPTDLRILHYLSAGGPATADTLRTIFHRALVPALRRLSAARLVREVGRLWHARALSRAFAATRIIAIEAKVSHWNGVLEQACLNTWFASSSYVLVPRIPRGASVPRPASALGVGVLSRDAGDWGSLWSAPAVLPRSYASWLFNDWAWRASHAPSPEPAE